MSYAIAVAQRKGGVGKTTLAVSVAAELHRRSKNVALIDADPQRSACQWAKPGNLQFPVYEVAFADQTIANWMREFNQVVASYDYVVVDTPPNERALGASVSVSNLVLVPCTPSGLDLEATARTLEIFDMVRTRWRTHLSLILVPNRVDARTLEGRQLVEELTGFGEVVGPTIGDRSAFVRAFSAGQSVADMPEGKMAHLEIQMLCDVVEKSLDGIIQRSPKT
jgi:chromosome partitioning protein